MTLLRRVLPRAALLVGVAAIAAAWLGGASTARAAEPAWLTVPAGSPMFQLTEVKPGDSGSATLTVTNPQPVAVTFSIAVTSLSNDDNGCNGPEQASGDTTCGGGGGELQSSLLLNLVATAGSGRTIADGTLDQWAAQPVVDTVMLSGYESRTYRVGYDLPIGTSNMVQSDLVSFGFEMRLDQSFDSVASDPPVAVVAATPSLPRTGAESDAVLMVALGTILVGLGLWVTSIRSRGRSQ